MIRKFQVHIENNNSGNQKFIHYQKLGSAPWLLGIMNE